MILFKRATNFKLLLLILAVSMLLRLPNLNRPLANQWELCTGISLVQLDIWQKSGANTFNYLLPINYPGVKELHIQNWPAYKDIKDANGNYYYLSFPPFYLLVPYFLHKLFLFPISPLSLQLLNIFLHFISLVLILKISQLVFSDRNRSINIIGLTACSIYTFSPSPLWFHTNIYIMFPFAIPILLLCTYLFLKIRLGIAYKPQHYLPLGASLFLLCYTEWIGYLAGFTYVALGAFIFIKQKQSKGLWIAITASIASLLALGLFVWQCASVVGWNNLIEYLFVKYNEYSGTTQPSNFGAFISRLVLWFIRGYSPVILALVGLLGVLLMNKVNRIKLKEYKAGPLLTLLVVPSALHHLFLRDFTINHEFSTLIDGLTLSILGGILLHYIIQNRLINKTALICLGLVVLVTSSISFFLQHWPGPRSYNGYPYNVAQKIGTAIKSQVQKNEPFFLVGYNREYDWQLLWYAKTNVGFCKDTKEVAKRMQALNLLKSKAFVMEPTYMYTGKIASLQEIELGTISKAKPDGY